MKILAILCGLLLLSCTAVFAQTHDWQDVEKALGRKGTVQGNILKVTFPRSDLNVRVGNVRVEPGLALTTWAAFRQEDTGTAIMGDIVLLEGEVGPVTSKLTSGGIWVTALHNHLLGERPRVMYVHFGSRGEPAKIAKAFMDALRLTKTPLGAAGVAKKTPQRAEAAWSAVEAAIGMKGKRSGNILSFSIPRISPVTEMSTDIPPAMGVATAINFQWDGGKAAASGDFVLTAEEVNPVISALATHGITVTAVHNHMLFESPRLFFVHFWGHGDPSKLALGLKEALGKTAVKAE